MAGTVFQWWFTAATFLIVFIVARDILDAALPPAKE